MIEFKYTKDGRLQIIKDGKPAGYMRTMGDEKRKDKKEDRRDRR